MRKTVLYPEVVVQHQSFKDAPKVTVPNQSMSLKEILRRFVRRESLPVERSGIYVEDMGDLEKMAREDLTQIYERIDRLKERIAKGEAARKTREELKKAEDAKFEADRLGGPVLTEAQKMAKSAGGIQGGGESPPETKK